MFDFQLGEIYLDKHGRRHLIDDTTDQKDLDDQEWDDDISKAGFLFVSTCSDGSHYYIKPDGYLHITHFGSKTGPHKGWDEDTISSIVQKVSTSAEDQIDVYLDFGLKRNSAIEFLSELDEDVIQS